MFDQHNEFFFSSRIGSPIRKNQENKIRKAIIDKNVVIPDGTTIGYDLEADSANGYTITESGIVVVPRKDK